jgi:two-component system, OmpR family, response regulator
MSDVKHVLIVDDEPEICAVLNEYLSGQGYQVSVCHRGDDLRRIAAQSVIDIVLLDLVMPGEDGLALAGWLRRHNLDVGIIMLTGRGETTDRIIGLEMGADDYLPKPFHLREVLARVNSLGRRLRMRREHPKQAAYHRCVRFAGWLFNLAAHELTSPAGDKVQLTSGDYDLLAAFVAHPREVLSRDRLLDLVCDRENGVYDRTIDVRVGRLRHKLNDDPSRQHLIKTVRGGGYYFTATVEAAEPPVATTSLPPAA